MNKIKESLINLRCIQSRVGIDIAPINKDIEEIESKLTEGAYDIGAIDLIVNKRRFDCDSVNISNLKYIEDYEVLTYHAEVLIGDEYVYFNSEDEYLSYCEEKEVEEPDDWYDFAQPDEIMWNTFWRFDNCDIDMEVANQIGLPVIKLNNGDTYVSINGCGMDLSFQIMRYQALTFGYIDEDYADPSKIKWAKINLSDKDYKEMISKLGVDIDCIDNDVDAA